MSLPARARARLFGDAAWRRAVASTCLGLATALAAVSAASAGTFEEGVAAQSRGDLPAAMAAFQDAAGRGEGASQYALGRLYLTGQGTARSYTAARGWFQKAAAQGNPGAAYELGQMCEGGLGEPSDYAAALAWYRQSAARGFGPAQISLAQMYDRGVGGPKDVFAAIRVITPAAQAGDGAAELELGMLYAEAARGPSRPVAALNQSDFRALMDRVFGRDNWRETSGYRTLAEENRLRAAGAGTVAAGKISRHSLGTADAPGAYDVVVAGISADDAAARLQRSSARFRRVLAEGAHGEQGPHLHVELSLGAAHDHLDPRGDGLLSRTGSDVAPAEFAEQARYWLQLAADHGQNRAAQVLATLRLGRSPG